MFWILVAMFCGGCIGSDCEPYFVRVCVDSVSDVTMTWTGPGNWSLLSAPSVTCDFSPSDGYGVMLNGSGSIDFGKNTDSCVSDGYDLDDCQRFSFFANSLPPDSDGNFTIYQSYLTTWTVYNFLYDGFLPGRPYRLAIGSGTVVKGERVVYKFYLDLLPENAWIDILDAEGLLQESIHVEGECSCTPTRIRYCENI